jgi:hypothetical protein
MINSKAKTKYCSSSFKSFNLSNRQKILILTLDFNKQHLENIKQNMNGIVII